MDICLFFLLIVSFVIIGERGNASEFYSDAWYKPAYKEVYAYKGPEKSPQQTLEDMKKLSDIFGSNLKSNNIKFMKKEIDDLIEINEWPAVCNGESLKKIQKFIRSEGSWQLYLVPYLRYQMDRMCSENEKHTRAKDELNKFVKNMDKDDDRELSDFISAIKKNDKKADVLPSYYQMPALVFRSGVIDYMKSNLKLDKKVKVNEFKEIYNNSLVKICKRYLEATATALERISESLKPLGTFEEEVYENLYPGIQRMWFKKQACSYATNTKFDLPGEIYELFKNPRSASRKYRKS